MKDLVIYTAGKETHIHISSVYLGAWARVYYYNIIILKKFILFGKNL